jgi:hypothetical protein
MVTSFVAVTTGLVLTAGVMEAIVHRSAASSHSNVCENDQMNFEHAATRQEPHRAAV